jgi:hypothetical protein
MVLLLCTLKKILYYVAIKYVTIVANCNLQLCLGILKISHHPFQFIIIIVTMVQLIATISIFLDFSSKKIYIKLVSKVITIWLLQCDVPILFDVH